MIPIFVIIQAKIPTSYSVDSIPQLLEGKYVLHVQTISTVPMLVLIAPSMLCIRICICAVCVVSISLYVATSPSCWSTICSGK